jgi:hypothetical protein
MLLGLLTPFLIGAVCAIRLPVLHFAVIMIIGICIYAAARGEVYDSNTTLLLWCVAYVGLLQIGYVFSNCVLYLLHNESGVHARRRFTSLLRSKYSRH